MVAISAATEGAADAMLDFDVIEARRRQLGLSKQALADLVEVDQSTIWRYRNKGMAPHLPIARKLAEVLSLSMDEITGKGNPTQPPPSGPPTDPPPSGPGREQ